jgi:hypothetical protein
VTSFSRSEKIGEVVLKLEFIFMKKARERTLVFILIKEHDPFVISNQSFRQLEIKTYQFFLFDGRFSVVHFNMKMSKDSLFLFIISLQNLQKAYIPLKNHLNSSYFLKLNKKQSF